MCERLFLGESLLASFSPLLVTCLADGKAGAHEKHCGDDDHKHSVGKDVKQRHSYGGGDGDVDDEGGRRPSQTAPGRPRVDMTREANIVLSGSSPRKMTGNTAAAMARFIVTLPPERRVPSPRPCGQHG
jgi:hypothetical protein